MRSSFDPVPRTCTSGMPNSCRDKAGMGKRSRRWNARYHWTRWLRGSERGMRRSRSPRGATMWLSGKPRGLPIFEPSLMFARAQQAIGHLLTGHADRCITLELGPYVGVRAMCLHSLGRVREAAQLADSLRTAIAVRGAVDSSFSPAVVRNTGGIFRLDRPGGGINGVDRAGVRGLATGGGPSSERVEHLRQSPS